jgi:ABC-2 type transport system permease protein
MKNKNKWLALYRLNYSSSTAYKTSNFAYFIGSLVQISSIILLWYINIQSGSSAFSFNFIFTYYVIGELFIRSMDIVSNVRYYLAEDIMTGKLTSKLLLHRNVWLQYFVSTVGRDLFVYLVNTAFLIIVLIIGFRFLITPDLLISWFLFGYLFISGVIISFLINIIIGSTAFYITNARGVISMVEQFKSFLTGRLIPLNSLPQLTGLIFQPFAFLFFTPLFVFTNQVKSDKFVYIILGNLLSAILLFVIATIVYSKGVSRYESVGI